MAPGDLLQITIRITWARDLDLVGQQRDVSIRRDEMLGELPGVLAAAAPLQDETVVPQQQPEILHPSGQLTPHLFRQLVGFVAFHGEHIRRAMSLRRSPRETPIRVCISILA